MKRAKMPGKNEPETTKPEDRRPQAFHEAGHAAMYFFFSEAADFHSVDITLRPRKGALGRTLAEATTRVLAMTPPFEGNEGFQRFVATERIMLDLAGFSAEYNVTLTEYPGIAWIDLEKLTDKFEPDSIGDYYLAKMVVQNYQGPDRQKRISLREIASWTDEAIREPRMWNVVEALANALLQRERLDCNAAWKIMRKAWGPGDDAPFLSTKTWRRRFRDHELRIDP